jgi:hypothetical protein
MEGARIDYLDKYLNVDGRARTASRWATENILASATRLLVHILQGTYHRGYTAFKGSPCSTVYVDCCACQR